jgi:serine/threonine-protein kinase HipA
LEGIGDRAAIVAIAALHWRSATARRSRSRFFDNLLPDSEPIRKRLASHYKLASIEAFDLLQEIGRDCVGAVQLLKEDEAPTDVQRIEGSPMSEEDVERHLIQLMRSGPLGRGETADDLRISLAGAQEKTALLWHNGGWMRPHGSTPTTHILKQPLGLVGRRKADLTASVENKWLCMNLLAEFGLPVAKTAILNFGTQKVLGVERFDRKMHSSGKWIMRLPQEDFCQALGVPPHLKYESDGGPGLLELATVLRGSERAEEDLTTLLTSQVLFWLMAAPDGHAKNFSIHLLPTGRYALAPLYDVMSIWLIKAAARINIRFTTPSWRWPYWARTNTIASLTCSADTSTAPPPSVSCAPMLNKLSKACWRELPVRSRQ